MSKLDDNNRWGTKMLVPELAERYDKRNEPAHTGRPVPAELALIRDSIILPYMLTMADKCQRDIAASSYLFKRAYVEMTQFIMDRITKDLTAINRELRTRNIKVAAEESQDNIMQYRFWCRGYEDRFGIVREVMRAEIAKRFAKYEGAVVRAMREGGKDETR